MNYYEMYRNAEAPNKNDTGVYFLRHNIFVVYVGMTTVSVLDRVTGIIGKEGHIDNKIFNNIKVIKLTDVEEIKKIEYYFINIFDPYYNIALRYKKYINKLPECYKESIKEDEKSFFELVNRENRKEAKLMADAFKDFKL